MSKRCGGLSINFTALSLDARLRRFAKRWRRGVEFERAVLSVRVSEVRECVNARRDKGNNSRDIARRYNVSHRTILRLKG